MLLQTGDSETPFLREGDPRQGTQVSSGARPQRGNEKVSPQVIQQVDTGLRYCQA